VRWADHLSPRALPKRCVWHQDASLAATTCGTSRSSIQLQYEIRTLKSDCLRNERLFEPQVFTRTHCRTCLPHICSLTHGMAPPHQWPLATDVSRGRRQRAWEQAARVFRRPRSWRANAAPRFISQGRELSSRRAGPSMPRPATECWSSGSYRFRCPDSLRLLGVTRDCVRGARPSPPKSRNDCQKLRKSRATL